jgi:hypothetical protein
VATLLFTMKTPNVRSQKIGIFMQLNALCINWFKILCNLYISVNYHYSLFKNFFVCCITSTRRWKTVFKKSKMSKVIFSIFSRVSPKCWIMKFNALKLKNRLEWLHFNIKFVMKPWTPHSTLTHSK